MKGAPSSGKGIGYGAIISLMLMVGAWFVGPELIKLVSSKKVPTVTPERDISAFCFSPCGSS